MNWLEGIGLSAGGSGASCPGAGKVTGVGCRCLQRWEVGGRARATLAPRLGASDRPFPGRILAPTRPRSVSTQAETNTPRALQQSEAEESK